MTEPEFEYTVNCFKARFPVNLDTDEEMALTYACFEWLIERAIKKGIADHAWAMFVEGCLSDCLAAKLTLGSPPQRNGETLMADNRMFLLHRPSGKAVYLGKRMSWGWYNPRHDLQRRLDELFRMVETQEAEGCQDDFCVALESCCEGATLADDAWEYTLPMENSRGIRTLRPTNGS